MPPKYWFVSAPVIASTELRDPSKGAFTPPRTASSPMEPSPVASSARRTISIIFCSTTILIKRLRRSIFAARVACSETMRPFWIRSASRVSKLGCADLRCFSLRNSLIMLSICLSFRLPCAAVLAIAIHLSIMSSLRRLMQPQPHRNKILPQCRSDPNQPVQQAPRH